MHDLFLTNDALRSMQFIEMSGVAMKAQEILELQQQLHGQLVVDPKLRYTLKVGYDNWKAAHDGEPPDMVKSPSFPELLFIPVEWRVLQEAPSGNVSVATPFSITLFFAVRKLF